MKKNKKWLVGALLALVACVSSGTIAYFTDKTETVTNTLTVGEIDITLTEPDWDTASGGDGTVEKVLPNQTIAKDPTVTNAGENPAYIFVEVSVPCKNIITAQADGTRNDAAETDLFTYTTNTGWTLIMSGDHTSSSGEKTKTYVYAYGSDSAMTPVAVGQSVTLFDEVKFVNAIEGQGLENQSYQIPVVAKAIQTTDLGVTDPVEIYGIIDKQAKVNTGIE